jgi:hypothetical protein
LTDWGSAYGSGGGSSSGGGGWAGVYGGSSGGTVAHHSGGGGGGGFLGLLENAGSDIGSTITGLPRGIESLGSQAIHTFRPSNLTENVFSKNPTGISPIDAILNSLRDPNKRNFAQDKRGLGGGTVAPFVGQERHIYGSALHGNFHPLYQHPLQPLLDLATVATGGGALAAKGAEAGLLGERLGSVANAERVLKSGDLAEPLNKARTLQGRAIQQRFDRYSMENPDKAIVGANPRLARISTIRSVRQMARARMPARLFQKVTAPLTHDEKFAFHIGAEGVPLPERISFYRNELEQNPTKVLRDYVHRLESPGVANVIEHPRPEFTAALHEGKALEQKAGEHLMGSGELTAETRRDRAIMPQEALRPDYPTPIEGNLVHPDFPTAFRFPHIGEEAGKPGLFTTPNAASGLREARTPGFLRHSEGVRLRTARLMTNPEVLTHDFLSTMRHAHLNDLRENVLRPVSKELDPSLHGGKLPDEHYFFEHRSTRVPRDVREQQALGQDLGVVDERGRETAVGSLANQTVFSGHDMPLELRNKSVEQLKEMGVRRVPAAFAKKYQSNFAGTGRVMRNFVDKPLDVWRAITLNARPAWMVNNLVGNAAQYALRYAGLDGAAAYLRVLLHTEKGDGKIVQLRNYTMRIPTLRRKYGRLFDEIAPELHGSGLYSANVKITHGGVYAGTKLERAAASRAAKVIGVPAKAVWYPIRAVGRGITSFEKHFAEAVPREAAMLREVEPVVHKLGLANQSVEDALHSLSPRDVELAVDRVNDYLGDFNSMNAAERRVIKRIVPFESWYRVIVQVSAKFAVHYPGRVNLLHSIAQAYNADNRQLPSWLKGAIPLGAEKNGVQGMLTTQGLNPYQTVTQLSQDNPLGVLNPMLGAAIIGGTGVDPFNGSTYYGPGSNSGHLDPASDAQRALGAFFSTLAPVATAQKVAGTTPSTLYEPKTYGHLGPVPINDALLQYLGLPIRHVKKKAAAADAASGR